MNIIEVFKRFPTQESCLAHLEQVRWQNKPKCPYCGSDKQTPLKKEHRYHCNKCNVSYSVTVQTIFHKTHLPIQKWFLAVSLILNAKKGVSARQLARDLQVNRNTAWRIAMQIREAMCGPDQRKLLQGLVEMDEVYLGGKPRKDSNEPHKCGRGTNKIPVVGMVERNGNVRAKSFYRKRLTVKNISALIRENIDLNKTCLLTDQATFYKFTKRLLLHKSVNHDFEYVKDGWIHTNTIESFWALLKRGIVGQFHKVSIKHLPKYINEFVYRFNNRKNKDVFALTLQKGLGIAQC